MPPGYWLRRFGGTKQCASRGLVGGVQYRAPPTPRHGTFADSYLGLYIFMASVATSCVVTSMLNVVHWFLVTSGLAAGAMAADIQGPVEYVCAFR